MSLRTDILQTIVGRPWAQAGMVLIMAQETRTGAFKRSSVTKMLIAELNRTTHPLPKGEGQYEAQTYLSPAGRVVAKVMICGTAIQKEDVGKEQPLWRMRITDPSGTTQVYAGGLYQPEAAQAIATLDIPAFVVVVGKLHLYEPEGEGGNIIVSLRPDSISILGNDSQGRDDFLLDATLSTLRSVRAASEDMMKRVTTVYGEKEGKDAYIFVARQALESLRDATAQRCDDKAGEDKSTGKSDTGTSGKQDGQKSKQGETSPAPPTLDKKPAPVESSPSKLPEKEKDKGATKKTTSAPAYPKKDAKEPAPAQVKGKAGKEIDESIKTVQEVVMQILHEEVQFKYSDLPEMLKKKGVNPLMADWESAVKRLMMEGYCCEPRLGIIRVV